MGADRTILALRRSLLKCRRSGMLAREACIVRGRRTGLVSPFGNLSITQLG